MENKNVGWLIVGIFVFIVGIILLFNFGITDIINATCSHGPTCEMYDSVRLQTWISIAIALVILLIGIFLIFSKESEKVIIKHQTKTIVAKKKPLDLKGLDKQERQAVELIEKENGAIFQKDLMERLNIGKVGITRLLDKLEAKQIIERKRRGMSNIVVLK